MTTRNPVKAEWAALTFLPQGKIMVCANATRGEICFCFNSIQELKEAVLTGHLTVKNWAVAVPDNDCIVRDAKLPAMDIKEASSMLEFELSTLVPLRVDEVVYGCQELGRHENNLLVRVFILRNKRLAEIYSKLRSAGLKPKRVLASKAARDDVTDDVKESTPNVINWADGSIARSLNGELHTLLGATRIASAGKYQEADLVSREEIYRSKKRRLLTHCVTAALEVTIVLVLMTLCISALTWRVQSRCSAIQAKIEPIKDIAQRVESRREQVTAIQKQLYTRGRITKVMQDLFRHTPTCVSISELTFRDKQNQAVVNLKGQADQLATAFDYADAMVGSQILGGLQIVNAQQIPRPGGSIVEFKAECDITE